MRGCDPANHEGLTLFMKSPKRQSKHNTCPCGGREVLEVANLSRNCDCGLQDPGDNKVAVVGKYGGE
jgi:hypothetical protein